MKQLDTNDKASDFANLVNLMSVHAEASTRMAALTHETQSGFLDLVDEHKGEYAELQEAITKSEGALEVLARRHPEWFIDTKTVKTPFGAVSFRTSTKLEVPNEEVTLLLIQQRIEKEEAEIPVGQELPSLALIRTTTELNLEALEKLDDAELQRLRIKRVQDDSFTVKPLKVDLGKAVKAAAEKTKGVAA